jgi:hypothetical protein
MQLPDQAHRDRQLAQPLKPMLHGGDIVDHLSHIVRAIRIENVGFSGEQIVQRALRAFNFA